MSDLRERLALYVLDELEPAERAEVEEALRRSPELREEEAAWRRDLGELLAESAPDVELSGAELDGMTERLVGALPARSFTVDPAESAAAEAGSFGRSPLGEVSERVHAEAEAVHLPSDAESQRSTSASWMSRLALAASLLSMIVAAAVFVSTHSGDAADRIADLERRNLALEQELAGLRQGLERTDAAIARVSSDLLTMGYPQSSPVVLAGLEAAPQAAGSAFYKPSAQQALFHAYGLPKAEVGTTYQLWYIPDGGSPVSAGLFEVDANGEATLQVDGVPSAEEIALWAVTVEPAGGSPQPTGTMVIRS